MSGRPLHVGVITSLYPSPPRPREGAFAEQRWLEFAARGHSVRIIHPQPRTPPLARGAWGEIASMPRREERQGLSVRRPRYWHIPGRARGNARRFARCAWRQLGHHDVLVCDYAWPAAAIAPYCVAGGLPCVINGRGSDVLQVAEEPRLSRLLGQYLLASGHWCAVSQDLVAAMDSLAGRPGAGLLVPNGVDRTIFQPRDRSDCRARLGLSQEGALVLVVGHLIPRKDPMLALETFITAGPPGGRLVFLGRGPLVEALSERASQLGAGDRVSLMGERSPEELALFYGACDVLLLTSTREGRPNVVLEALACGRPVLATAAGGTGELLTDPRMLSRSRDPEQLARMLGELLAAPPDTQQLVASVADFSWEASLDRLECLLFEAACSMGPARLP